MRMPTRSGERNHQGLGNELIDGASAVEGVGRIRRLGSLMGHYGIDRRPSEPGSLESLPVLLPARDSMLPLVNTLSTNATTDPFGAFTVSVKRSRPRRESMPPSPSKRPVVVEVTRSTKCRNTRKFDRKCGSSVDDDLTRSRRFQGCCSCGYI